MEKVSKCMGSLRFYAEHFNIIIESREIEIRAANKNRLHANLSIYSPKIYHGNKGKYYRVNSY